jgi:hypothetical protein
MKKNLFNCVFHFYYMIFFIHIINVFVIDFIFNICFSKYFKLFLENNSIKIEMTFLIEIFDKFRLIFKMFDQKSMKLMSF